MLAKDGPWWSGRGGAHEGRGVDAPLAGNLDAHGAQGGRALKEKGEASAWSRTTPSARPVQPARLVEEYAADHAPELPATRPGNRSIQIDDHHRGT